MAQSHLSCASGKEGLLWWQHQIENKACWNQRAFSLPNSISHLFAFILLK
jgi:hypothetical protein